MNLNEHVAQYRALDHWFSTSEGSCIAKKFTDELACFDSQLRGDVLLQLGSCGENFWLPSLQYRQKIIVSPCNNKNKLGLLANFNQLPIDRNSIDCIIAPFTAETYLFDKYPMDELDRILKPMGTLVFLGVNPTSLWGLGLRLGRLRMLGEGRIKPTSVFSLKRSVLSRGYRQCALNTFYYIPPCQHEKTRHRLRFLNVMGKMLWLYPAGFYCLIVQKHQFISPTPLWSPFEENFNRCVDFFLA